MDALCASLEPDAAGVRGGVCMVDLGGVAFGEYCPDGEGTYGG